MTEIYVNLCENKPIQHLILVTTPVTHDTQLEWYAWYAAGTQMVRSWYAAGQPWYALVRTVWYALVRIWYAYGTHMVRIWYAVAWYACYSSGTHMIRFWYASGTHLVRSWSFWYASWYALIWYARYAHGTHGTHLVRIWYASGTHILFMRTRFSGTHLVRTGTHGTH